MTTVLLTAHHEIFMANKDTQNVERYRTPEVLTAIDLAISDVEAAAAADHPYIATGRHLLMWFLHKAGRNQEAFEQLKFVDGNLDARPWRFFNGPTDVYVEARRKIVLAST